MIYIADHQTDDILSYIPEEDFWDDNHHKSLLDNQETFDFVTFADKPYSQHLEKMNRIIIQDEDGDWVELYIRNTRKDHDGDAVFTEVYTSATYVRLKTAKQIAPHRTEALSAEAHATRALNGTEWTIGIIDFKGVRTFTFEDYVNPYDYLRRIASEFNLELRFKVETNGNKITRRYVDIVEYVGSWNGKVVEFGKDLIGIERKEDFSNVVTALIGLGPEDEEGNRLEVFVEDLDALQRWGRNGQHIIGIYEPESTDASMPLSRLRELTENELEKRINSKVQYMADVVDLEDVTGLEHEKFRFGSFLRIKDLKFNPPLYLEARVHTQNRSIKKKSRPKTVILGDFIEYSEEDVHAIVKDLRRQLRNKIGLGDLEELTYTKPEVDQKVSDVVDDAQQAAVEVVDSIEIGGRNIASVDSVGTTGVTRDGYTYTIAKTGSSNPFMRIPTSRFEENKRYVISFKVKKISGNVISLAGHDQSFRGMPVEIYRDGIRVNADTWSVGDQNFPNDNEMHEYEIHIRTPETFPSDDSAPYWYIQPNRPSYGEDYVLELWDFQIEQSTKKTGWNPAPEDVQEKIASVYTYTETEINELEGQIQLKADATVIDGIESRIMTAELNIDGLEGQITSKVEADDVRSIFLQEAGAFTFSADQINFDGHVFGQNATFEGRIEGAEIVSSTFNQSGSKGSITLDQEGLKIRDASNSLRMILSTTNGNYQSFSPSSIIFEPNDNFYELVAGTGLSGLGDGFFGFKNSAPNRTLNMLNEGNGSSIQFFSPQVNIGGRLVIGGGLVGQGRVARLEFNTNRSSVSSILWNASGSVDYGMVFNVDGNNAARLESDGTMSVNRFKPFDTQSFYVMAHTEVRVTDTRGYNGGNTTYIPIRARSFEPPQSLRELKHNIDVFDKDTLDVFRNSNAYLFNYNFESVGDKRTLGIMLDEVPVEIHSKSGTSVDLYSMSGYLWKGVKDLIERTDKHEDDINFLKMKNQYLEGKVEELERKIA